MADSQQNRWTRDELLVAINLYCKPAFGKIHIRNPEIIHLAELLGRTPSAVSWKLANLANIDDKLERKGASNVSKLDRTVWAEFFADWDAMAYTSECRRCGAGGAWRGIAVAAAVCPGPGVLGLPPGAGF